MFIRRAVAVFLELWSDADPVSEWIVDWRWFEEWDHAGIKASALLPLMRHDRHEPPHLHWRIEDAKTE